MDNITRRQNALPYIADEECDRQMKENRRRLYQLNKTEPWQDKEIERQIRAIFGRAGKNCTVNLPFRCDYGFNIEVGDNFYANYNLTILDVGKVTIGDNVMIAPNVSIYTAGHPIHPDSRNSMYEYGIPITIGSNCWIGGSTVICPGVTIGEGTVIGAGSVVTKDIPSGVVAAGNPCRVLREITDADRQFYFKNRPFDEEAWDNINRR